MKLSEIPGIGDIYNTDISELREKVSFAMRKSKAEYEALKAIGGYLFQIEKNIAKLQKARTEYCGGMLADEFPTEYQNIKLGGYFGSWSAIDSYETESGKYVLLSADNQSSKYIACGVCDNGSLLAMFETVSPTNWKEELR